MPTTWGLCRQPIVGDRIRPGWGLPEERVVKVNVLKVGLLLLVLLHSAACMAAPKEIDPYHWSGVERVVAIGDIHGDYNNYIRALEAAGLVDRKGKWSGGAAHLVQTGDIPDRGPDTRKIMEHLDKLAKQADRKGGQVHSLIGNHEAMNVYGDLRYVTTEEFSAFANKGSPALIDRYYTLVMQDLQAREPEKFAALPETYREEWNKTHPPGWVEHRQAWDPAWNPEGELLKRTLQSKVAVQVNDMVFLHGGISGSYCQNSLQSLTDMVVNKLKNFDPANTGILEDPNGPLWYRGLSGSLPAATPETVAAILQQHNAKHIVVGHTPTGGAIFTRYDGAVIQIDTGMSKAYGGHPAYLEATAEGLFAGYPEGKIPLPSADSERAAYLQQVMALYPRNGDLQILLDRVMEVEAQKSQPVSDAPTVEASAAAAGEAATDTAGETEAPPAAAGVQLPTCGISQ
jgi:hypothetical protein